MSHRSSRIFTALLLCVAIEFVISTKVTCDGPNEYKYNNCECLKFVLEPQTFWQAAADKCDADGGQLVIIEDSNKQEFIADILDKIATKNGVWIGLRRVSENLYKWVDGTVLDDEKSSWDVGEPNPILPNQDCVLMHRKNKKAWHWKDYVCDTIVYSRICQYDLSCQQQGVQSQTSLTTNEIIGIVVGGILGLISACAIIFLMINCCRDLVRRKQGGRHVVELRVMETGSGYDEPQSSEPMIPPPERLRRPVAVAANDLDRASIKRKKGPLVSANVLAAFSDSKPKRQQSVKISNLPPTEQEENSLNTAVEQERTSFGSIEDNYFNANKDTGSAKEFASSMGDIDKLK